MDKDRTAYQEADSNLLAPFRHTKNTEPNYVAFNQNEDINFVIFICLHEKPRSVKYLMTFCKTQKSEVHVMSPLSIIRNSFIHSFISSLCQIFT